MNTIILSGFMQCVIYKIGHFIIFCHIYFFLKLLLIFHNLSKNKFFYKMNEHFINRAQHIHQAITVLKL